MQVFNLMHRRSSSDLNGIMQVFQKLSRDFSSSSTHSKNPNTMVIFFFTSKGAGSNLSVLLCRILLQSRGSQPLVCLLNRSISALPVFCSLLLAGCLPSSLH